MTKKRPVRERRRPEPPKTERDDGLGYWQRKRVMRARDPEWLRERARQCRKILAGRGRGSDLKLRLLGMDDPKELEREAARCEARARATP